MERAKTLGRSGGYSWHCTMNDSSGSSGEFILNGQVQAVTDSALRALAESISSYRPGARTVLFELAIHEAHAIDYRFGRPHRRRWPAIASH